ncbi:MAG: rhodanese [Planctomycetes bacterium]|nr:rhodanese [Planctomycetota bacterium]
MTPVATITPADLAARLAQGESFVLLDVREPVELALARIDGVRAIPLGELVRRAGELDPDLPTVCICHHGIRSARAAGHLASSGFRAVFNLAGGIDRWSAEVDARIPRY